MEKTIPPGDVVVDVPFELRVTDPLKSVLGFSASLGVVLLMP
jgi:hypothetical protein